MCPVTTGSSVKSSSRIISISATVHTGRWYILKSATWQPAEVRSLPCGGASLPVQAKCRLPGLLRRELLGPRAHECGGPRVAGVALEWIAPEEGPSATDTDRLLSDRDDRALHGDVRRPGALDRLQWRIDLGLRDCPVVERAGGLDPLRHDLGLRNRRARHPAGQVGQRTIPG